MCDLPMQPFQKQTGLIDMSSGSATVSNFIVVPPGKRLIIETILGRCAFGMPNQVHTFEIGTTVAGGPEVRHVIPQIIASNNINNGCFLFGFVRLYADPGTAVNLFADRNFGGGSSTFRISLSGHLHDV
jgi:hypothetical protein